MHKQERQFGFVAAGITASIGFWPLWYGESPSVIWLLVAVLLLLIAVVRASCYAFALRAWLKFGHYLGIINTYILLALVFFLLITPVALVFRLMKRDTLCLRARDTGDYWVMRKDSWTADSFKDQF